MKIGVIIISAITLAVSACGQTRTERAVTGAGAGALLGLGVGAILGDPRAGAAIGAGAGGILGAASDQDIRVIEPERNDVRVDDNGRKYILRYDSRTNTYFREYI